MNPLIDNHSKVMVASTGNLPNISEIKQKIAASSMDYNHKVWLEHAVDAVNHLGAWTDLYSCDVPCSFLTYCGKLDPIVERVVSEICKRDDNHSYLSMAWTIRAMQYIAWDEFDKFMQGAENRG